MIMENERLPTKTRPLLHRIAALAIFSALIGLLLTLAAGNPKLERLLDVLLMLIFSFGIFAWCYHDSQRRGHKLGFAWRIFLIFFGWLGLFVYLFRSRGLFGGLRASALAILTLLAALMFMVASALVFTILSGAF